MAKLCYIVSVARLIFSGFRRIEGHKDAFVAKDGRIRVVKEDGKIVEPHIFIAPAGYQMVILEEHPYSVHRIVGRAFIPNPEGKSQINHKDADKTNNSVSNLEWVTPQENMRHAAALGLLSGPKSNRKLSPEQVKTIREDPRSSVAICEEYGITSRAIRYVRSGAYYRDVAMA